MARPPTVDAIRGTHIPGGAGVADAYSLQLKNSADVQTTFFPVLSTVGNIVPGVFDAGTLTIASGVVTLPAIDANISEIRVGLETEGGAATDDLTSVAATGTLGFGVRLSLRAANAGHAVVVKHSASLFCSNAADFPLASVSDRIEFERNNFGTWHELSHQPSGGVQTTAKLTIASGAITLPVFNASASRMYVIIETEALAASDDLDTITLTGTMAVGNHIVLHNFNAARNVVVIHNATTMILAGAVNKTLDVVTDALILERITGGWHQVGGSV